jgi:FAD/FMN-containing dehydrogenase
LTGRSPDRAPVDRAVLLDTLRGQIESAAEIRGLGSCTSKSPCFETAGLALSMRYFDVLEVLDGHRVRAGAGVVLRTLLDFLRARGLGLPTLGEWSGQTLAGAISTGTHGGSHVHGSLCSSVEAVTLMDGHGEVKRIERGDPAFAHVLPSFGTTGLLLEFELQCEPAFDLSVGRQTMSLDAYLEELVANHEQAEFRAATWLPATGEVVDYAASRVVGVPAGYGRDRDVRFNVPVMVLDWLSRKSPRPLPFPIGRAIPDRHFIGPHDEMLAPLQGTAAEILAKRARNRTPPEGEFALPVSRAVALVHALQRAFRELDTFPDRPVGLRPGAHEPSSLMATQEGPSIWVSLFVDPANPLMRVLPGMLADYGARPHWGKCVFHDPADIAGLYPAWGDFEAYRRSVDPAGVFLNAFARGFGLGQSASAA